MAIRKISSRSLGDTTVATADIADGQITSAKLDTNIAIAGTLDVTGATTLDTDTLVVDSVNNRVGIGTSSPSTDLDITTSGGQVTVDSNGHITSKQSLDAITAGGRIIGKSNRGIVSQIDLAQAINGSDGGYISFLTCNVGETSPTERMRLLAGGGLTFNGDASGNNALDDYEEGTFNIQLSDAGGGSETLKMKYAKIGRLVAVEGPFRLSEGNTSEAYFQLSSQVDSNITCNCTLPFVPTDSGATTSHAWRNLERQSDGSNPGSGWMPVLAWPGGSAAAVLTDSDKESSYYAAKTGNSLRKADNRTNVTLQFNFVYFTAT